MAVTIDATSNSNSTNGVGSKSWSHTIGGVNRLLLVAVQWNQPSDTETVTSVTYGGTALTQVGSNVIAGSSGLDRCVAVYGLVAPATGTATIAVTMSAALAFYAGAVSFNGVHQSMPLGTPQTNTTTTAASIATTLSSATAEMVFSAAAIRASSSTTGPITTKWNILIGTNNRFAGAVQAGASSVTSTYSWTTADTAALMAVAVKPATSLSITSQASITGALMSSLTDDFSTDDDTKWTNVETGSQITVTGGQVQISAAANYPERDSIASPDLRNNYAFIQIVGRPTQTGDGSNSTEMGFGVQIDNDNYFVAILNGTGNVVWRTKFGGVAGTTGFTAYNTTSMKWLRWRNAGATVYLEAAGNVSGPWTQLASYPVTFSLAAVQAFIYAGYYGSVASPGTAIFDNFNVGFTKTLSSQAHIIANRSTTVSSRATITVAGGLEISGLGFSGNPSKIISSRASIIAGRTLAITSTASIAPSPLDLSQRPAVSEDAEDLYTRLAPYTTQDADYEWALLRLCDAVTTNLQSIDDVVRTSDTGPGWSSILDIDLAPGEALPWLGQFVGISTIKNLDDESQRLRLHETSGFQRGTLTAIEGAARQYLTGNRTVLVDERDTSPYHLTVTTFTAETPDPAVVEAALIAEKPAGLVLAYVVVSGSTYGALAATGMTYGDLAAAYPTYAVMKLTALT